MPRIALRSSQTVLKLDTDARDQKEHINERSCQLRSTFRGLIVLRLIITAFQESVNKRAVIRRNLEIQTLKGQLSLLPSRFFSCFIANNLRARARPSFDSFLSVDKL